MRTDTERLDWILAALDSGNGEPLERLQAAYTLELRGRTAMDAAMGAKLVEPGEPMPALTAIDLAVAELGRIRSVKGFSEERDDGYVSNELAEAAACYMFLSTERSDYGGGGGGGPAWWPWASDTFKPSPDDRKKELTKGIALALCELDRLIRAERRAGIEAHLDGPEHRASVEAACEPEVGPREFRAGDRVRVLSNSHDNRFGWAEAMDALVGQTHPIDGVYPQTEHVPIGYYVAGWVFPAEQLEHVDG